MHNDEHIVKCKKCRFHLSTLFVLMLINCLFFGCMKTSKRDVVDFDYCLHEKNASHLQYRLIRSFLFSLCRYTPDVWGIDRNRLFAMHPKVLRWPYGALDSGKMFHEIHFDKCGFPVKEIWGSVDIDSVSNHRILNHVWRIDYRYEIEDDRLVRLLFDTRAKKWCRELEIQYSNSNNCKITWQIERRPDSAHLTALSQYSMVFRSWWNNRSVYVDSILDGIVLSRIRYSVDNRFRPDQVIQTSRTPDGFVSRIKISSTGEMSVASYMLERERLPDGRIALTESSINGIGCDSCRLEIVERDTVMPTVHSIGLGSMSISVESWQ